jgi:hypothetical protein
MQMDRDFADAFDDAFASLREEVEGACAREGGWPERAAAAILATLDFAAARPAAVAVLVSDAFANGLYGALRYRRMVAHFSALLEQGRRLRGDHEEELPAMIEEALLGGFAEIVSERLRYDRAASLPSLGGQLIELLLTPYLGAAEAKRIAAARSAP